MTPNKINVEDLLNWQRSKWEIYSSQPSFNGYHHIKIAVNLFGVYKVYAIANEGEEKHIENLIFIGADTEEAVEFFNEALTSVW